jgi:16S rRNA (cytosine1402-N4)-methyltransferase
MSHMPVMLEEVMHALQPRKDGIYVDATFGGGGYARALLERADCRVIGIDRDPDAIARGQKLVEEFAGRLTLRQAPFSELGTIVGGGADGIAFDLGVSSYQLDDPERGFSFRFDAPLDMRMGKRGRTAAWYLNNLPETEIIVILARYGEERRARSIAKAIVLARPIETTRQLAELVERVLGPQAKREKIHPATRTFQALRIYVNDELREIESGLAAAERVLVPRGRLAVVTFHSLEDRIVKKFLAARTGRAGGASRHAPPSSDTREPTFRNVGIQPTTPTDEEIARNPRARSAKLRAAKRTAAPPWPPMEGHA